MNNGTLPFSEAQLRGYAPAQTRTPAYNDIPPNCGGLVIEHTKELTEIKVRLDEQERVVTDSARQLTKLVTELSRIKNWIIGAVATMVASQMGFWEFVRAYLKIGG